MQQPEPAEIADRLVRLRDAMAPRKKVKSLFITKALFNKLAERQKIEEAIFVPVSRRLRRSGLLLVRMEGGFAVVDAATIEAWERPRALDVRRCMKPGLDPAAAWPFPTGRKQR
jgi:hypothetical protein